MRKAFVLTTVTLAILSFLLLVALTSWTTYWHFHQRTGFACRQHNHVCLPGPYYVVHARHSGGS